MQAKLDAREAATVYRDEPAIGSLGAVHLLPLMQEISSVTARRLCRNLPAHAGGGLRDGP